MNLDELKKELRKEPLYLEAIRRIKEAARNGDRYVSFSNEECPDWLYARLREDGYTCEYNIHGDHCNIISGWAICS